MTDVTGYVSEIFRSIQGEGICVGERQIFVRTAGCSATCRWCDTVESKTRRPVCLVHGREVRTLGNPLEATRTVDEVMGLVGDGRGIRSVSITGGEPLEQADFVAAVAVGLKENGRRIHLETNGLHADALAKVVAHVDIVAMDIKLPSATGRTHWDEHGDFLEVLTGVESFAKVVVDHSTPPEEIDEAVDMIARAGGGMPLVLQPESATFLEGAHGEDARRVLMTTLEYAQSRAIDRLGDVRVIPQCHKILKVR
jgi:organic radical activating enzyme